MSWRNNLRSASFRGVKFKVLDSSTSFGRRTVLHEYPFKDIPYAEDMGKSADEFTINAYIVNNIGNGFDYFGERNALISALKKEGAGVLVHPFYGNQTVNVFGKPSIAESFEEGGIARFSISFVQAGENKFPDVSINALDAVDKEAAITLDILKDAFVKTFTTDGAPGFSLDTVSSDITSFINMTKGVINSIYGSVSAQLETAKGILDETFDDVAAVLGSPCEFANVLINGYNSFLNLVNEYGDIVPTDILGACSERVVKAQDVTSITKKYGKSIIDSLGEITFFGEPLRSSNVSKYGGVVSPIAVTTPARARQAANRIAMTNLLRNSAIVTATKVATRTEYKSQDETTEIRDIIIDAIDRQLTKIGDEAGDITYADFGVDIVDNGSYMALERLRAVFVPAMSEHGATLANLINYTTKHVVESTLSASYDRYNDIDRIDEIYNRNYTFIKHPGFIPNNEIIEVLSQ